MSERAQVGIYLRQSKWHDGSISIELQEQQCRRFAQEHGWEVSNVWRDEDTSGRSTAKRDGLRGLRAAYDRGEFSIAVAHSVSRFARNMSDGADIVGAMPLATVLEGVQDTDDDFVPLLHMLLAHKQSREIGKRWAEIVERRIKDKLPASGGPRYGYRYTFATVDDENGKPQRTKPEDAYQIDPEQARHVELMYSKYIEGAGFTTIVEALNSAGSRTVKGNLWTTTRLLEYMDRGFAAGILRPGSSDERGVWEPIITEDTWQAYRRERNRRKKTPSRTKGSGWELQGIARCALCGGPLSRSGRPGMRYARCSRNASSGSAICKGVSYLESSITEQTTAFLEQRLAQWAGQLPDDSGERQRLRTAIDACAARIEDVAQRQSRLIDMHLAGDTDEDGYRLSRARMDEERSGIEQEREALEDELAALGPEYGTDPLEVNFRRWDTSGNPEAEAWQEKQLQALTELEQHRRTWEDIRHRMEPMTAPERRAVYGRMLEGIYVGPEVVRIVARDGHEETLPRLAPRKKGVRLSNKAAPGVHGEVRAWALQQGIPVNISGAVSERLLKRWEEETGRDRSVAPQNHSLSPVQ